MRVAIIQGHPDTRQDRFCHALAEAYEAGARQGGHEVRRIEVARLDFPLLHTQTEFVEGSPPPDIQGARETIAWANHLVIVYPLWLGAQPALLRAFFEQVFRNNFAMRTNPNGRGWTRLLKGRSARVIVTMGMPATFFRLYFGAHGTKALKRGVLGLGGISPIRESLIGMVESRSNVYRGRWLARVQAMGRTAA